MQIEVSEFYGNLSPEEFLYWLGVVKEILEFKNVSANARVALVATRLRGWAVTWWQQLKLTQTRMGKSKITDWEKMTRKLGAEFLPYNFRNLMYQKLQNLCQGLRTIEEYTTEFYQLLMHNDIQGTQDQLVSMYCGGLRAQIVEAVNLFDPIMVSEAHQRALQVEKTVTCRGGGELLSGNNSGATARSGTSSGSATSRAAAGNSGIVPRQVANPNQQPRTSSGLREGSQSPHDTDTPHGIDDTGVVNTGGDFPSRTPPSLGQDITTSTDAIPDISPDVFRQV
ncbi:hypothetical protein Dsin_003703 [Dipteronia sinensis]|uniref:Retrotransposon gag domain-containing protein n=1 Tax=Dipteronia sinensis TaxID=43782 RepID=A0AAE0B9M5_9ROSI|nr:hypothetical protein Dsin_003703 [Dipteronia sinensis]